MDEAAARAGPREPGREGDEPPPKPTPWTIADPDRSGIRVEARGGGAAARCVVCHDDEEQVDLTCVGCGATYHVACAAELGQCATRGCQADPTTGRLPPPPPEAASKLLFGALMVVTFGLPIALVFRVLVGFGGKLAPELRDGLLFGVTAIVAAVGFGAPLIYVGGLLLRWLRR